MTEATDKSAGATPWTPDTGGAVKTPGAGAWGTPSTHGSDERADDKAPEVSQKTRPVRRLGSGGQGTVWLVEHLGRKEAHKILSKRGKVEADVFREAENTRKVDHPNIVDVFGTEVFSPTVLRGFGLQEEDDCPALRMEYVDGWDLARLVEDEGAFPVEELVPLALQVAAALRATHECGIVHHDLKPSNLILRRDRRTVVVTDFGISAALRERDGKLGAGRGGTPFFMAPELHEKDGRGTPESDIWSLGVTLYFLATRTYPFPFESARPEVAVRGPARDPCETYRHVSPEFWQLLRRMLRQGGARPFTNAADLQKELEIFATSLDCPACGGVFRLESIAGACPEPACQSRSLSALKKGLVAQREGESALAGCEFAAARGAFERARLEYTAGDLGERAQRCAAVLAALPGLEQAHTSAVEEARAHFAAERYVKGIRTIASARVLFSRSSSLNELRMQTRERILEAYRQVEPQVAWHVRNRDFKAARDILTRVDHYLGEEHARRELLLGLGEEPSDFRWLYDKVEERELRFHRYTGRAREAILAFEFDKAIASTKRLESEFSADENAETIQRLNRAIPAHAAATAHAQDFLAATAADPRSARAVEQLDLRAGLRGSEELLASFPPQQFPPYQRFEVLRGLYGRALEAVLGLVREQREEARTAARARDPFRARELLDSIRLLVLRSDVFEIAEREAFLKELREAEEKSQEIERLYAEGSQALEQREYAEACLAFRQLSGVAPEGYRDLAQRLALATQRRDEVAALDEEVVRGFAQIEKASFTPDGALHSLRRAQRLDELANDTRRDRLETELAAAVTRLFDSQREHAASTGAAGSEKVLAFLGTAPSAVVQTFPAERWPAVVARSAELRRALVNLLERGLPVREDPVRKDPAATLARAESLLQVLQRSAPAVTACVPPPGAIHPSAAAAKLALEVFHRGRISQTRELLPRLSALLVELKKLAPPELQPELGERQREVQELERRSTRHLLALRVRQSLPFLIVTGLAFAAAIGWGELRTRWTFEALHGRTIANLGLTDEQRTTAMELVRLDSTRNAPFFEAWARVKNDDAGWFSVPAALDHALASHAALHGSLHQDVQFAAEKQLATFLTRALTVFSSSPLPGEGFRDWLRAEIESMARALVGADAEGPKTLREQLKQMAVFVGSENAPAPTGFGNEIEGLARSFQTCERRRQLVAELIERSSSASASGKWDQYWAGLDGELAKLQALDRKGLSPFEIDDTDTALERAAMRVANLLTGFEPAEQQP